MLLQEKMLKRLALKISETIRDSPLVLENSVLDVSKLSGMEFVPTSQNGLEPPPVAYRFLEDLISLDHCSAVQEIFSLFQSVKGQLIWGHAPGYTKENVGQEFLDNYCHALLTGPDGPLKCASPLGAFVLFGPHTLYRDHSHAPNEVYLALTGGGEWRVGQHSWTQLNEGQTIFIPSNEIHAIRTAAMPLLTFSFWLEPGDMNAIAI